MRPRLATFLSVAVLFAASAALQAQSGYPTSADVQPTPKVEATPADLQGMPAQAKPEFTGKALDQWAYGNGAVFRARKKESIKPYTTNGSLE